MAEGTLTFGELRRANVLRLGQFRNNKGELAHSVSDGSDWSDAQWLQAVVGELGEYANLRKKIDRGDITKDEGLPLLADELADVVVYLDLLSYRLGIDLGEAVRDKWNRTSRKVGFPLSLG